MTWVAQRTQHYLEYITITYRRVTGGIPTTHTARRTHYNTVSYSFLIFFSFLSTFFAFYFFFLFVVIVNKQKHSFHQPLKDITQQSRQQMAMQSK